MNVRAKFHLVEITLTPSTDVDNDSPVAALRFMAARGKDNESWSKWTPSGELRMTITNPAAAAAFELGQHYYLDFTKAPAKD